MNSLHLEAKVGDIAETVLLPGDPMRAKYVAENMLDNAVCYNQVRGMYGYTGYYNGVRVSIQGTGMGMGSAAIYIHELINTYKVKNLIRVGTCGGIQTDVSIGDVLLAVGASGDSDANMLYFNGMHYAATADFDLMLKAYNEATRLGIKITSGDVFSSNTFYDNVPNRWDKWKEHGVIGVDMETQILYTLAKKYNVKGLSLLTISDNILTGESSSAKEREQSYMDMMKIGFELAKE